MVEFCKTRSMEILFFLFLPTITFATTATVVTQSGIVIGFTVNYKERSVSRFLGIPYAQPPVGNLRFKKTMPVKYWSEPLVADTVPPSCKQQYPFDYPWVDKMPGQSEDCLYLNIWVPERADHEDLKAVMFWIHGGGFSTGSGRQPLYDGQVLAAEGDVIVVTINYRLGIFGFLSAESEDAPGNMGLYDVLEALKWINKNIEAFGGDKKRITLFGQSAGGSISGFFTVSPLATGLFQRIISQSGSTLARRGDTKKENLELGQKVAKAVLCASDNVTLRNQPKEVLKCLRDIAADVLINAERSFKPTSIRTFSPIFYDEFLPVNPLEAIKNGNFQKVDLLSGVVKDEGSIFLVTTAPELCGPYGELNPEINRTKGADLIRQMFEDQEFKEAVVDYYLSDLQEYDYDTIRNRVYHSQGDFQIHCPTLYLMEGFTGGGKNTYYYYFEHQNSKSRFATWMEVAHSSEIAYVFGLPLKNPWDYRDGEVELSKTLIESWTIFAKDGVPSLESDRANRGCTSDWYRMHLWMAKAFKFNIRNKCLRSNFSPSWQQYPYTQEFYVLKPYEDYLKQHQRNCEFFRPLFRL